MSGLITGIRMDHASGGFDRQTCWQRLLATVLTMLVLTAGGCGDSASTPDVMTKLVPVTGSLTFNGTAAPGAVLTLRPADGSTIPDNAFTSAVVGPDGKFEVRTSLSRSIGAGAVPGDYVVSISWVKPLKPHESDGEMTPELLPAKYQDPKVSPVKIKVEPGRNELPPLDLTP